MSARAERDAAASEASQATTATTASEAQAKEIGFIVWRGQAAPSGEKCWECGGELLTLSPSHRGWPLYCHRCQIATRCRAELAAAYERENEGRGGDGEPVRRRIRAGLTLLLVFPTNCTAALSINESALSLNEMALSLNEMGTDDGEGE